MFELKEDDLIDQRGYIIAEFCCETYVQANVVSMLNAYADLLAIAKAVVAGGMSYPKHLRDKAAEAVAKAEQPQ